MLIFKLLFVQIILFAVIVFVLKKLIFSDTTSAVSRLSAERKRAEQKKEEMARKMEECEKEVQERLNNAKTDAEKIKNEMLTKATEEAKNMGEKAQGQAEDIISKANSTKDMVRKSVEDAAEQKMILFSTQILEKILTEHMSERLSDGLVDEFIEKLNEIETAFITDITSVTVVTSFPLKDEQKKQIKDIFSKKIDRDIEIQEELDKSIIAGAILKFGTLILDGSFASKLTEQSENIKKSMEK